MRKNDFLKQCRLFLRTLELGSLGRAADEAGMGAAQASRTIAALERDLGTKLFLRSTSGMRPTPEGAAFAEQIVPLLKRIERIESSLFSADAGEALVALPPAAGSELFGPWLGEFEAAYPSIRLSTEPCSGTPGALGESDYAVLVKREPPDLRLVATELGRVPLMLAASPEYLARSGVPERPEDLARHRLIASRTETELPIGLRRGEEHATVDLSGASLRSNLLEVRAAAAAGGGIAVALPRYLFEREAPGRLVEVLPEWRQEPESMWFLRAPQKFPSFVTRQLLEWIERKWEETPGLGPVS